MASTVNSIITSGDLGGGLIPTEYATQIIQDAPKSSVSLTRMRQIRMSTRTRTQPVLDSKPIAYWVGGDTGLKQTTKMKWSGLSITAEELAAIVPIPEAVIADSGIPIWPEVMPRLASALGYKLDQATLFGVDKPSSFPDGIIPQAIAAHNTLTQGKDLAKDVASMGQKLAEQGFAMNGFASKPGLNWELIGLRNANGTPIYVPSLAAGARPPCTVSVSTRLTTARGMPPRPCCSARTGRTSWSASVRTSPTSCSTSRLSRTITAR